MTCQSPTNIEHIIQGNSHPVTVGFTDSRVLDSNWICYLQIREKTTGAVTTVERDVTTKTTDNTQFTTFLTKTETNSLTVNVIYTIGMELENPVTGECYEIVEDVKIEKQRVVRP